MNHSDDIETAKQHAKTVLNIHDMVQQRQRVQAVARELLEALEAALPLLIALGDYVGNTLPDGTDRCAVVLRAREAIRKAREGL